MKSLIYEGRNETKMDLVARIVIIAKDIREISCVSENKRQSSCRCKAWITVGGHSDQLL